MRVEADSPPRAVVLTVGDELLLGRTVDTNAAWMSLRLAELGVEVVHRETVADRAEDIAAAVRRALERADVVLTSGGLGPTPDDITREVVAETLGRPLHHDEEILQEIERRFRARGIDELPQPNRRVACVPEGARKLANPHGTAPGLALTHEGRLLILLPGVPRELRGILEGDGLAAVRRHLGERLRPVHTRTVHTTQIPESLLAARLHDALPADLGPVGLAFLPDLRGVDVRLTARGVDRRTAEEWFERVEAAAAPVLAPWRFEAPSGDLAEALLHALRERRTSVATAESCTGGLVAARLTAVAGASDVMRGGVVAYANEAKTALLGVAPDLIERHGAVSAEVAAWMARGAAERLGAGTAVALTGIAGPSGGTPAKPVGTVFGAAFHEGETVVRRWGFPGDRAEVRERAAQAALALLFFLVEGRTSALDGP